MITPRVGRNLGGFHHRVSRCLAEMKTLIEVIGSWVYPHLEVAMSETVLKEVEAYVIYRQNIIAKYIVNQKILDL